MNTPHVVLEAVSKQYGQRCAVDNISLHLMPGECVGLAGHNGAGKSTLIKLILGLITPTSGRVTLLGENASGKNAFHARSQIGYLPETAALHPMLTGKETLDFYARLKGQPLTHNLALLEKVGIAQAAGRRVGTYSKGMRQRLALAQALLGQPKVLLLDEPTTGLDPASRQMFYRIIRELVDEGACVLLSTHALAELDGHADRVVVLKNGSKTADGNLYELQAQSGLPARIRIRLKHAAKLSSEWTGSGTEYTAFCPADATATLLQSLGSLDNIEKIDIHTPTLDEMYAEFLKREDR